MYMSAEHTARDFREESWLPLPLDHRPPLAWVQDPVRMIDKARSRARELFASAENRCPLSHSQRQAIGELIAEANAKAPAYGNEES
jgi:hypothetical protein